MAHSSAGSPLSSLSMIHNEEIELDLANQSSYDVDEDVYDEEAGDFGKEMDSDEDSDEEGIEEELIESETEERDGEKEVC